MARPASLRQLVLIACAPLAACDKAEPPPQAEGQPVTSLAQVAGDWDIVRFGDYVPPRISTDGVRQAWVTFGDGAVGSHIECNYYSSTPGDFDATGRFRSTARLEDGYTSTLMLCPPEEEGRENRLAALFRTHPKAEWLADGRLQITTSDGFTMELARPEDARRAHLLTAADIEGEWHPVSRTIVSDGGYSGGSMTDDVGILTFSRGLLTFSGCPALRARYSVSGGVLLFADPEAVEDTVQACASYGDKVALFQTLLEEPFLEQARDGQIVADADGEIIALTRQPLWLQQQEDMLAGIVRDADGKPIMPQERVPPPPPPPPPSLPAQ